MWSGTSGAAIIGWTSTSVFACARRDGGSYKCSQPSLLTHRDAPTVTPSPARGGGTRAQSSVTTGSGGRLG